MTRPDSHPMLIQGLRTNNKDPDSHVVLFDAEALIGRKIKGLFSINIMSYFCLPVIIHKNYSKL